jgi:hypothetical protein
LSCMICDMCLLSSCSLSCSGLGLILDSLSNSLFCVVLDVGDLTDACLPHYLPLQHGFAGFEFLHFNYAII